MVTLNIMDTSVVIGIVVLVLAIALCFLAMRSRQGGFFWIAACFAWAGVAATWQNEYLQGVAIFAAVISVAMFLLGA